MYQFSFTSFCHPVTIITTVCWLDVALFDIYNCRCNNCVNSHIFSRWELEFSQVDVFGTPQYGTCLAVSACPSCCTTKLTMSRRLVTDVGSVCAMTLVLTLGAKVAVGTVCVQHKHTSRSLITMYPVLFSLTKLKLNLSLMKIKCFYGRKLKLKLKWPRKLKLNKTKSAHRKTKTKTPRQKLKTKNQCFKC